MTKTLPFLALCSILYVSTGFGGDSTSEARAYPLQHKKGEAFLRDQNGDPHFLFVDANWALPYFFTREEAVRYLDDRQQKGFSMIKLNAVPWNRTWNEAGDGAGDSNAYGAKPFVDRDPLTPNEAYWVHFDWLLEEAGKRGLQLLIETPEFFDPITTPEQARAVGRFLGRRYGPSNNLIWLHGSDRNASQEDARLVEAMVSGIREFDTRHLHTFHPGAGHDSIEGLATVADTSWLGLVWSYAYRPGYPWGAIEPYVRATLSYRNARGLPVYLGEAGYEEERTPTLNTAAVIRRQIYWFVLNGALAGHTYGHGRIWLRKAGWEETLDAPGARHAALATQFFRQLPWYEYTPDTEARIVIENRVKDPTELALKGDHHVACALRLDGTGALLYLPPDRPQDLPVALDLAHLPGKLSLRWIDPTTGASVKSEAISGGANYPLASRPNTEGSLDWIVLIEQEK
ncbi:MAG: DUF4038 domain-containing protein [Opitutaceae bacterium]|nr:DUF4038 domain-containing protein [Opitutaceae bacterium]